MMPASQPQGPRLSALLRGILEIDAALDRDLADIASDSRTVRPGTLFLARTGLRRDARDYIAAAIAAGAVAVAQVSSAPGAALHDGVPVIGLGPDPDSLARLAARFFGEPSRSLYVVGVTGTNGKTSVSHYLAQALSNWGAGGPCGLIGTLGMGLWGRLEPATQTTPEAVTLHRGLAVLRGAGARRVVMEVSSHGLDQGRVAEVAFDAAVFTNLSRDHLDYHGDMQTYGAAKERLFRWPGLRLAVLNLDDPVGRRLRRALDSGVRVLGYSLDGAGAGIDLGLHGLASSAQGMRLEVATSEGRAAVDTPLLGRFNAANLMAALGILLGMGMPVEEAAARLSRVRAVPGRMERFTGPGRPLVVVDYAHTPDALEQALRSLRPHCAGRLWCVFGCGGERDRGKRPLMGAAAERLADALVLTDDNPRAEDGGAIIEEIQAGLRRPAAATVERARAEAIRLAVGAAGPGDLVLVAGKGHETYQEVAGVRHSYSDRAWVTRLLGGAS